MLTNEIKKNEEKDNEISKLSSENKTLKEKIEKNLSINNNAESFSNNKINNTKNSGLDVLNANINLSNNSNNNINNKTENNIEIKKDYIQKLLKKINETNEQFKLILNENQLLKKEIKEQRQQNNPNQISVIKNEDDFSNDDDLNNVIKSIGNENKINENKKNENKNNENDKIKNKRKNMNISIETKEEADEIEMHNEQNLALKKEIRELRKLNEQLKEQIKEVIRQIKVDKNNKIVISQICQLLELTPKTTGKILNNKKGTKLDIFK